MRGSVKRVGMVAMAVTIRLSYMDIEVYAIRLLQEFWRFYRSHGTRRWLAFFMWVNVSLLVFLYVPVIDKWNFLFLHSN